MQKLTKIILRVSLIILATALTVAVILASLSPRVKGLIPPGNGDKAVHFAVYYLLFIVWYFTYLFNRKFLFVLLFLMGVALEVLQEKYTTVRHFDWWDIAANTSGLIFAYFAVQIIALLMKDLFKIRPL